MKFDTITRASCVIPVVPPADPRCLDSDFALSHPDICSGPGNQSGALIIKPSVLVLCVGDSVQFRVYEYKDGVETLLDDEIRFSTSDSDIFQIGVLSGSGTCVGSGIVKITGTHTDGRTVSATIEVNPAETCCDNIDIGAAIVVDNSKSMSLPFGAGYASRLEFAKTIASIFAGLLGMVSPPAGGGGGGGGGSTPSIPGIYEYTGADPNVDGIIPDDPNSPAIAYKKDGTGPIYGWNIDLQVWN